MKTLVATGDWRHLGALIRLTKKAGRKPNEMIHSFYKSSMHNSHKHIRNRFINFSFSLLLYSWLLKSLFYDYLRWRKRLKL